MDVLLTYCKLLVQYDAVSHGHYGFRYALLSLYMSNDLIDYRWLMSPGGCFTILGELPKRVFKAPIFRRWKFHSHLVGEIVLEIIWRLRIGDAEPESNF